MKKLPKTLFVRREVDGDEIFLVAEEAIRSHCDLEEVRIVGKYELVEQVKLTAEIKTIPT